MNSYLRQNRQVTDNMYDPLIPCYIYCQCDQNQPAMKYKWSNSSGLATCQKDYGGHYAKSYRQVEMVFRTKKAAGKPISSSLAKEILIGEFSEGTDYLTPLESIEMNAIER